MHTIHSYYQWGLSYNDILEMKCDYAQGFVQDILDFYFLKYKTIFYYNGARNEFGWLDMTW